MAGIRTFVAIKLNDDLTHSLDRLMDDLRPRLPARSVRWVDASKIHLTLKFLGDVGPSQIAPITEALEIAAGHAEPFSFELSGLSCFPNTRRPRVVWVGVHEPSGVLRTLHKAVDTELKGLGFEPERRAFSPHLTLGRVRRDASSSAVREIGQVIESLTVDAIGRQGVTAVHLFKSDLRPSGAVYTSLAELHFREPQAS